MTCLSKTFNQTALNGERCQEIMTAAEDIARRAGRSKQDQRSLQNIVLELCANIINAQMLYGLESSPSLVRVKAGATSRLFILAANYAREEDINRCRNAPQKLAAIPRDKALSMRMPILLGQKERLPYSNPDMGGASLGLLTIHGLGGTVSFRAGKKDESGAYRTLYSIVRL